LQSIAESRTIINDQVSESLNGIKTAFLTELKNVSMGWKKFVGLPDRYNHLLTQAQDSVVKLEILINDKTEEISQWAPSPSLNAIKDVIEHFLTRIQAEMLDLIDDSSLTHHRRFLNQRIGSISKNFSLLISPP